MNDTYRGVADVPYGERGPEWEQEDVHEIELNARLVFRVRATSERDAEAHVDVLIQDIGTFMVDLKDWRFTEAGKYLEQDIVEIYAETV
jgi:hypothetical protein